MRGKLWRSEATCANIHDLKSSHVDTKVIDNFLKWLNKCMENCGEVKQPVQTFMNVLECDLIIWKIEK